MAKRKRPDTPSKRADAPAVHLTASMRVLRSHLHRPGVTVGEAQGDVKELALRLGTGQAKADDLVLEEKLRKATGVHVAELARYAEDWPE